MDLHREEWRATVNVRCLDGQREPRFGQDKKLLSVTWCSPIRHFEADYSVLPTFRCGDHGAPPRLRSRHARAIRLRRANAMPMPKSH
jgi:hypothetical protein